ncbi:MAG: hypothetical protein IJA53_04860 [Spirochaetaceae bacterium]|nr:hypothetical protein [Spirochaetaceae bacterium]
MNGKNKIEDYKVYVFFHRTITNVGGGEIYLRNKINFLKKQGFKIIVISTMYGKVFIEDLNEFKSMIIPELCYNPFIYTEKKRQSLLKKIDDIVKFNGQYFIESHSDPLCIWAELYAKQTNSRNFIFLIDDNFRKLSELMLNYYIYKHKRRELLGIAPKSLYLLFNDKYSLPEGTNYHLPFFCNNSVEESIEGKIILTKEYDYKLATISRLEKLSVPIICSEIKKFAKRNVNKTILYVIFGGSENKRIIKELKKKFMDIDNVDFFITGFIYPISLQDVKKFDLFISLAGSARATYNFGIPTLTIEVSSGKPLGILGVNTEDTQYSSTDKYGWNSIEEALVDYFKGEYINQIEVKPISNLNDVMISHLKFVNETLDSVESNYFDFPNEIYDKTMKGIIIRFISSFFSDSMFYKVLKFLRKCSLKRGKDNK